MRRPILFGAFLVLLFHGQFASAQTYTFVHFAGSPYGKGSVDGIGADAKFNYPYFLKHSGGALYVGDFANYVIRRVNADGSVSTLVGMAGEYGVNVERRYLGRLALPYGITADSAGNLYVVVENTIKKITPSGVILPFAGSGSSGFANATGAFAMFNYPGGLATDSSNNVYVADSVNHLIRMITPAGVVTTLAGTVGESGSDNGLGTGAKFNFPTDIAVDPASGIKYVSDSGNHTIRRIALDGNVTTLAGSPGMQGHVDLPGASARFRDPRGLVVSTAGDIFVVDGNNHVIRRVTSGGSVSTIAGSSVAGGSADGNGTDARFQQPHGITIDPAGDLYVADLSVRKVTQAGVVTTLAGRAADRGAFDSIGTVARFSSPAQMGTDSSGNIYVADEVNHLIRKIAPGGIVSTFAGLAANPGHVNATGTNARFNSPKGIAVDSSGNVYVGDKGNHAIRMITSGGVVTTIAGSLTGVSGNLDASGTNARFNLPEGVALDGSGNLFVADKGNHTIRRITGSVVTTPAGSGFPGAINDTGALAYFNGPIAVATDASGNVYVADQNNSAIRKMTPAGFVTTFAGTMGSHGDVDGTGPAAGFYFPSAIARDPSGNFIVVGPSHTVRKITPGAVVTTIGGKYEKQGSEDGTHNASRFDSPAGVTVDSAGNIYVSDSGTRIVRGSVALTDTPTIDASNGPLNEPRQLGVSAVQGGVFSWSIVRKPAGSTATLSSTTSTNPTFTPDLADLYVFRLRSAAGGSSAIRDVSLIGDCPAIALSYITDAIVSTPYSQQIIASGGTAPYLIAIHGVGGSLPPGLSFGGCTATSCTVSGTPTAFGTTYGFTIRATDFSGCTGDRDYQITTGNMALPTGLQATTLSATSVSLTWSPVAGAEYYAIYRRTGATFPGAAIDISIGTSFTDTTAAPSTGYMYAVTAAQGANFSGNSNLDSATTVIFSEGLTAGITSVKTSHVNELRTAVNLLRPLAAASATTFTDPTLSSSVMIKRAHVSELRKSIDLVRAYSGMTQLVYTDPVITPGTTTVKAAHINELRSAAH